MTEPERKFLETRVHHHQHQHFSVYFWMFLTTSLSSSSSSTTSIVSNQLQFDPITSSSSWFIMNEYRSNSHEFTHDRVQNISLYHVHEASSSTCQYDLQMNEFCLLASSLSPVFFSSFLVEKKIWSNNECRCGWMAYRKWIVLQSSMDSVRDQEVDWTNFFIFPFESWSSNWLLLN